MKIVSTGATISSSEFYKKKLKVRRQKLAVISFLLLVFLALVIACLRFERFRFNEISISGAVVTGEEPLLSLTQEILSGYYLWLLPKDSVWLYPSSELRARLVQEFPRLSLVKVSLAGTRGLNIEVLEREPMALYCSGEVCYFLDDTGFIFDLAPTFSEGVYLIYRNHSLSEFPLGQLLLPSAEFVRLNRFLLALNKLSFDIEEVGLEGEVYRARLAQGGELIWSTEFDYEMIYANLEAFLKSDEVRGESDFISRISELDLTIKNKIRWTMKD